MPRIERDRELSQRRNRKVKLAKLVRRYALASAAADKEVIAAKVRRISPFYDLEARLAQLAAEGRSHVPQKKK